MSRKKKTTDAKDDAKVALVPRLRFPEFLGEEGWTEKRLGRFLTESRLAGNKGNIAKKITVKLWGNGVFEKNEAAQGSVNTQYFRRRAGQFIYSKLDFLNQAFGIVPKHLEGFESTVDLPCFDISESMDPVFLLEYVKRKEFYERVGEAADGSRRAKRIQVDTFLECVVALPSPAEQQKIAECLISVDGVIAAQARKMDALKTHKKGLMQQLFPREGETQPRLRFPEFQNDGDWGGQNLEQLSESISSGKDKAVLDGLWDLYGSTGIIGNTNSRSYHGTYLLVARVGANAGFLTKVTGEFGVTDNTLVIDLKPQQNVDFILFSLDQFGLNKLIFGSGQPLITGGQLKALILRLPKPREQHRIAACLSSLDALITAETQKLDVLKRHKRALMQQLFPAPEAAQV